MQIICRSVDCTNAAPVWKSPTRRKVAQPESKWYSASDGQRLRQEGMYGRSKSRGGAGRDTAPAASGLPEVNREL